MRDQEGPAVGVHPPLLSVAAPVAAVALEWLVPLGVLPAAGSLVIVIPGLGLLGLAGWLAVSGEKAFRRAGTNVDPRQAALVLVQDGPYRFTRNPMYLGMVVLQVGLALTFSLDWALLGAIMVWTILDRAVVVREEAYLTERFGEAYRGYLAQSRRWL
ncbi:methyltransferase family protein [Pacificoceanicola onchidii]|uniref:methyltransferase family protein n=1 Tax=Pacificoceanicola onchidii TaxID=2562685 RepID=UPI0010A3E069|nr:isoprenylcysteine carboxylmethyltransferase family protein [Pacificoceanicola onchidii]